MNPLEAEITYKKLTDWAQSDPAMPSSVTGHTMDLSYFGVTVELPGKSLCLS